MHIQDIRQMAKAMQINTFHMKKKDIVRAIQDKEQNIPCFGTGRVQYCEEDICLWREDCLSFNDRGSANPNA